MPAAITTSPVVRSRSGFSTLLSDYALLTKPRVSLMVIITAGAGFYLGCLRSGISPFSRSLVEALFGIAMVTAGSSVLNQALERRTDLLMVRTAQRPMAQLRVGLVHGLLLGFAAIIGDLAESIIKRSTDTKDSGNMLPGIGGVLDLIDSLLFTAPLLFFYSRLVLGVGI